jgi:hypothetical protein
MFCSSCGSELSQERAYCSRCGNNLRPVGLQPAEALVRHKGITAFILATMAVITVSGFFATVAFLMALVSRGANLGDGGGALAAALLFVICAADWMLIRLLARVLNLPPAPKKEKVKIMPLPANAPYRLDEPRVPVDSVTDHTTRTFPPVYVERSQPK